MEVIWRDDFILALFKQNGVTYEMFNRAFAQNHYDVWRDVFIHSTTYESLLRCLFTNHLGVTLNTMYEVKARNEAEAELNQIAVKQDRFDRLFNALQRYSIIGVICSYCDKGHTEDMIRICVRLHLAKQDTESLLTFIGMKKQCEQLIELIETESVAEVIRNAVEEFASAIGSKAKLDFVAATIAPKTKLDLHQTIDKKIHDICICFDNMGRQMCQTEKGWRPEWNDLQVQAYLAGRGPDPRKKGTAI